MTSGGNFDVCLTRTVGATPVTANCVKFIYDSPSLSSLNPSNVPTAGGTAIELNGANFGQNPKVYWNNISFPIPLASAYIQTHVKLVVLSPIGVGLGQKLFVQTTGQNPQLSGTASFDFDAPIVTGVGKLHLTQYQINLFILVFCFLTN